MAYVLLTGVTGLVGRYLVKDLLLAGQSLAVLVRPTRRATARQRIESVMAYWDEQLGRPLPRPVVLEGDITEPDLGLNPQQIKWVAEHCDSVLHNAASLTFQSTSRESEPWRSNVTGTANVLDLCKNAAIRQLHHVSTAYTCGLRNGRILETELDVGQKLSNDYEESKVQSEKMVRAADFIDRLTVYRPAIIIGDSQNGYTTTYHGFYAPVQLVHTICQTLTPDASGKLHSQGRLSVQGKETKNLIPVDWVSAVMSHIFTHPEHHGKTYHLTPQHPITMRLLADVLEQVNGFYACTYGDSAKNDAEGLSENEKLFYEMIRVYDSYWRNDPTFDTTHTDAAAPHLPCPHIDRNLLLRLARSAISTGFSTPRAKPVQLEHDVHQLLERFVEAPEPQPRVSETVEHVGLQVVGAGGGEWNLTLLNNVLVSAEEGADERCTVSFRTDIETFASLAEGVISLETALNSGRILSVGTSAGSTRYVKAIFQAVYSPTDSAVASPHQS